ncbi:rho guanine nucleotide exchange factor 33 isoform X2 [Denticeps clupeoides]|uniref:DH domain-containing protein n=1 Tax=Denticeps clupeoides TaxID=299321 RepID=A0AAY4E6S3_9TELE|nr:rho guanine nucleotide exchange factor 33 isoform X2 [Denticeps clupeoides]
MENGKAEDGDDGLVDETDLHIAQMHALWAELKVGLGGVVQDVAALQMGESQLEEKISAQQRDSSDKILSIRNTLNTLQEDLNGALTQISQLCCKQKDLQRELELLRTLQHRKSSKGEASVDGHASLSSQTELSLIQHYISSLPVNQEQPRRSRSKSPVWRERQDNKDLTELNNQELSKRQTAALELLESERVYISYLSLLLKANITFNGSESANLKDKRPFPTSLRFLIQQHLELLHVLQERVLKSQWQGIMGDVFLRLTSKESDFLDQYISYLKELPECLSVVNMFTSSSPKPAGLLEGDIMGDETRPPLHTLLLQPVQRIPEYLMLLQNLMQQTESEHPDYYLLLVCVQHLRSFTTQYGHLLQHNQGLLTHSHAQATRSHSHLHERLVHTRKELSRSSVKQLYKVDYDPASTYSSSSAILESSGRRSKPATVRNFPDWDAEPPRYDIDLPSPVPFPPDADLRVKAPVTALRSIPETEGTGTGLVSALGAFLPYGQGDTRCDHCSSPSPSSDSSIDIAFVRCSPTPSPAHQSHARSKGSGGYRAARGGVSPDSVGLMRPRPLQAAQGKSKSLNGLQLDSIDSPAHTGRNAHPRLERQSSAKNRTRHLDTHTQTHADTEEQSLLTSSKTSVSPTWGEELKWRAISEESSHTPLSERSRKQEGKGFRSSFKKLFKKKSGGEKEKASDKTESCGDLDSARGNRLGDIDRGTAV